MDAATVEVGQAGRIDNEVDALIAEPGIVLLRQIEGHAVFKARASPGLDKDTQEAPY